MFHAPILPPGYRTPTPYSDPGCAPRNKTTPQIRLNFVDIVKDLLTSCSESGAGHQLLVEPAPHKAEQSLWHEDDHRDKDDPDRNQIVFRQEPRQPLTQQQKKRGAEDRSDQGADAADDIVDHHLTGDEEEYEVGCGKAVLDGVKDTGQPGEKAGEHHRDDLVALDRVADGAGARLVLADRLQHHPERRLSDAA